MTSINNTSTNDGSPGINFDSVASAFPQGPTDAGRRLTEALAARFPKTADEALPAIEYRVGSLRALRPCTNLGEAIELARRDDAALREETLKVAHKLADGPRVGYRYMKINLNAAEDWAFEAQFDQEALNMGLSTQGSAMVWKAAREAKEG